MATTPTRRRVLLDLRAMIGVLFTGYGLICGAAGVFASDAALRRAAGVNINLWVGAGMLVFGGLMLLWWWRRPLTADQTSGDADAAALDDSADNQPGKERP